MPNIHASCVSINGRGVLVLGPSGSGKSDICLRLITNHNAILVSDDRVDLNVSHETSEVIASAPIALSGFLEVRGVGILELPHNSETPVKLVVELASDPSEVERMPEVEYYQIQDTPIRKIKIYPFEISAAGKIVCALQYELHSK